MSCVDMIQIKCIRILFNHYGIPRFNSLIVNLNQLKNCFINYFHTEEKNNILGRFELIIFFK